MSNTNLDQSVARVMACRDFAGLLKSVVDDGYVPTLRTDLYRGKRNAVKRADVLAIRAELRARGHRVWPETVDGE